MGSPACGVGPTRFGEKCVPIAIVSEAFDGEFAIHDGVDVEVGGAILLGCPCVA